MSSWLQLLLIVVGCVLSFFLIYFLVHRACKKNESGRLEPVDIMFIGSIEIYIMLAIMVVKVLFFS